MLLSVSEAGRPAFAQPDADWPAAKKVLMTTAPTPIPRAHMAETNIWRLPRATLWGTSLDTPPAARIAPPHEEPGAADQPNRGQQVQAQLGQIPAFGE